MAQPFAQPLRMPLATGATAFKSATNSLFVVPFLWGLWPLIVIFLMARDARRRRASDIVFDGDGFTVKGGLHDGYRDEWKSIKASEVMVKETSELFEKTGDKPAQNIFRFTVSGITIAESADPSEIASLRTLVRVMRDAATLSAATSITAPKPPTPTTATESCSQCGAPLVPSDVDEITCVYCGAKNVVPTSLCESIRLAAQADRARQDVGRAVSHTLTRGNAIATNYAVLAFWIASHIGLVIAVICVGKGLLGLVMAATASGFALAAIVQILLARRHALRGLTFGCAATTPLDPTQAPMCRRCHAPLPSSDDPTRVIATCAYCQTANILGLSLGLIEQTVDAGIEIEDVMRKQRRGIAAWTGVLVIAAIAMASGVAFAAS